MLNQSDYNSKCSGLGISRKNRRPYSEYCIYEDLWEDYIQKIVLPAIKETQPKCIKLIICESCPKHKLGLHPNPNYIFDNLNNIINAVTDKYLDQIWGGIQGVKNTPNNYTKKMALVDLAKMHGGPYIILDLLPSHGINLITRNRNKVNINPVLTADIGKISWLINQVSNANSGIKVNATFATPPNTTKTSNVSNAISRSFNWFLPTINSGYGASPQWKTLNIYVANGF